MIPAKLTRFHLYNVCIQGKMENGECVTNGPKSAADQVMASPPEYPDGFPPILRKSNDTLNGWRILSPPFKKDPKASLQAVVDMELRDDDVLLAAFPKCGTHWLWEVIRLLRKGDTVFEDHSKEQVMLEFCEVDDLKDETSPRTLNSHLPMCQLPAQIKQKKIKIVHVVRNPKDTFVSYFHHLSQHGTFTFTDMLVHYLANNLSMVHQFDYLRQFQQYQKDNPEVPVLTLYYEDMKQSPVQVTQELAQFLGLTVTADFCQEVVEACSFSKMKENDSRKKSMHFFKKGSVQIYRKGQVGDWKNQLTVAQNEIMDEFIERESQGLDFHFTYV